MTDPLSLDDPHVEAVLAGRARYDDLDRDRQAVVRAEWDARASERLRRLSFAGEYIETDEAVAEANDAGDVVWVDPRTGRQIATRTGAQGSPPPLPPLFPVDLTVVGDAEDFVAPLPRPLLGGLLVGDEVVVPGDASPDRAFRVVGLSRDGRDARLVAT